jgi:hypothetical protein
MTATYDSIATTTLGSAANTITFSSIPSTYTDLRVVLVGQATSSFIPVVRFNSDSGTNYSITQIQGNGTAASSTRLSNRSFIYANATTNWSATIPNFTTFDIFSYASSTNKTVLVTNNQDFNGSGVVIYTVGLWRNTAAITSLVIQAESTNFATGTAATLYGIKSE